MNAAVDVFLSIEAEKIPAYKYIVPSKHIPTVPTNFKLRLTDLVIKSLVIHSTNVDSGGRVAKRK